MMELDKDVLLTEWQRCTLDWQPVTDKPIGSRELRALCDAGLVEMQATSKWTTTSGRFPEVVTTVFRQTGLVSENQRLDAINVRQYFPYEWCGPDGNPAPVNERLESVDSIKLTDHGAKLAAAMALGAADVAGLIDYVEGVANRVPGCLVVALNLASYEVDDPNIDRPAIGADNQKKDGNKQPHNPDVSELCRHLEKKLAGFASENQCARDFCEKNRIPVEKSADLLRQARRFPHVWKG